MAVCRQTHPLLQGSLTHHHTPSSLLYNCHQRDTRTSHQGKPQHLDKWGVLHNRTAIFCEFAKLQVHYQLHQSLVLHYLIVTHQLVATNMKSYISCSVLHNYHLLVSLSSFSIDHLSQLSILTCIPSTSKLTTSSRAADIATFISNWLYPPPTIQVLHQLIDILLHQYLNTAGKHLGLAGQPLFWLVHRGQSFWTRAKIRPSDHYLDEFQQFTIT